MVEGWADHCSSDEDDEDEGALIVAVTLPVDPTTGMGESEPKEIPSNLRDSQNRVEGYPPAIPPREKEYTYPTEPPYTAYVGNLAYSILEPETLIAEVSALVVEKLGIPFNIVHARIMKERENDNRPRGFGYVEVETLEMLKALMELNSANDVHIAGRRVQFDVSVQSNRRNSSRNQSQRRVSSDNNIDGSKFRGGSFTNRITSAGSNRGGDETGDISQQPQQRPSLKLKPRSKPLDGADESLSKSQSSIFGGAKPRDETSWRERRDSEKVINNNGQDGEKQPRRDSRNRGRGGEGGNFGRAVDSRGRIADGGGRGRGHITDGAGGSGRTADGTGRGRSGDGTGRGRSGDGAGRGRSGDGAGRGRSGDGAGRGRNGDGAGRGRGHNEREGFTKKAENLRVQNPLPIATKTVIEAEKVQSVKPKITNSFAALAMQDSDSD